MVKTQLSDIIAETLRSRAGALCKNVTQTNALLNRLMANQPKPRPLTAAEKRERAHREALGRKYLKMAHELGVYDDDDY